MESTMKGNPTMPTMVEQVQQGENDSWLTLIEQFWQATPYSKLIPLNPTEIIRALQQIWLAAIKTQTAHGPPTHTLCNNMRK